MRVLAAVALAHDPELSIGHAVVGVGEMTARVPVIAKLKLPDGREFDCHTDVNAQYADGQAFWWTEGNGGCDCNRTLYLNREYGLGLVREPEEDCWPCGDTIELLSLTIDGQDALELEKQRCW